MVNSISDILYTVAEHLQHAEHLESAPEAVVKPRNDLQKDYRQSRIMIVDDEPINVKVVRKYLTEFVYTKFVTCTDSKQAINLIRYEIPDVILLDVMMPEVSGIDILREMHSDAELSHIPVIVLTASTDRETRLEALELGAIDFLGKPVDPSEIAPRLRNVAVTKCYQDQIASYADDLEFAVRKRTRELDESRKEVIRCLARAAEFRDDETGRHIARVGRYARLIAEQLDFTRDQLETIELAAQLHDLGKIGIPDSILLKSGKLTPEEFELIQKHSSYGKQIIDHLPENDARNLRRHSRIGSEILSDTSSPILEVASSIALTHHERWDGTGYPLGLEGEDIPLEGRITAVADVFDALSTKRPYKDAFPISKCFEILEDGRGTQFDPKVLDAFFACRDDIVHTQIEFADPA